LVELRYPSLYNVCEYAYELQENKIVNLRYDALAYILNSSNITHTSKVLIIENTDGIVTAGAVERMGEQGNITLLSLREKPAVNLQSQVPYMFRMNNINGNNITFLNFNDLQRKTATNEMILKNLNGSFTS